MSWCHCLLIISIIICQFQWGYGDFNFSSLFKPVILQDCLVNDSLYSISIDSKQHRKVSHTVIPRLNDCLRDRAYRVQHHHVPVQGSGKHSNDGIRKHSDISSQLPTDFDDHYKDLLHRTRIFRGFPYHSYAGYHGPWIENFFIDNFMTKPISYFSGMMPLFIQWTDIHCYDIKTYHDRNATSEFKLLGMQLAEMLRHDIIYITVIQDDEGLSLHRALYHNFPNILVFSAGGFGNVPIPLIKGELDLAPPLPFRYELGFYGSHRRTRERMAKSMLLWTAKLNISYYTNKSEDWLRDMVETKVNLAPRGFGRTSFRLAEIIQLGRYPAYLYDDIPWTPYGVSRISVNSIGLVAQTFQSEKVCMHVKNMTAEEYDARIISVLQAREYYTYCGVMKQMSLFFRDPFGVDGGALKCIRHPITGKR